VIVIDYGIGNLGSILNMLRKAGIPGALSSKPSDVLRADRLVLPGVGSFDDAMSKLRESGYADVLTERVIGDRVPVLGICLGMQMLGNHSEEGEKEGLGWLDAETVRFNFPDERHSLKVPHMGWNTIRVCKESVLFQNPDQERRFYFVHSFHMVCVDPSDVLCRTNYGVEFVSSVCHNNIVGTQFHPEKSHRFGLEFLKAFASWSPETPRSPESITE
jgi:glutamine amidotransferase